MRILKVWHIALLVAVLIALTGFEIGRVVGFDAGYNKGIGHGREFEDKVVAFHSIGDGGGDRWVCYELDQNGERHVDERIRWIGGSWWTGGPAWTGR